MTQPAKQHPNSSLSLFPLRYKNFPSSPYSPYPMIIGLINITPHAQPATPAEQNGPTAEKLGAVADRLRADSPAASFHEKAAGLFTNQGVPSQSRAPRRAGSIGSVAWMDGKSVCHPISWTQVGGKKAAWDLLTFITCLNKRSFTFRSSLAICTDVNMGAVFLFPFCRRIIACGSGHETWQQLKSCESSHQY